MRIIHSEAEFGGHASVVALGMFDGVHIGHQKLIREAVKLAGKMNAECVVCTFDRHPLSVISPEKAPKALLTLEENLKKFEILGANIALVKAFTPEFSAVEPEDYLKILTDDLHVKAIVVGENYTFGKKGRGTPGMICEMAEELGYQAVIVPPVMDGEVMASSSRIRALIREGRIEHAQRLLKIADTDA